MTYRGKVGLGVMTWRRPERFRECRRSILEHLARYVDAVVCVQDGGECYIRDSPSWWRTVDHGVNRGWAETKNECLDRLVQLGCEHLFMIEDDTVVTSHKAVTGYVDAALESGLHYLTAHPWGEATTAQVRTDGLVTCWAYVGSWWTYMSRYGYRTGGGYNEYMGGIMGDIELPQRWARLGLTHGWGCLPDATGSEGWVEPHCLTVDQSTIANQPGWLERQEHLIGWWDENMPETMPAGMRPAREHKWRSKCLPTTP